MVLDEKLVGQWLAFLASEVVGNDVIDVWFNNDGYLHLYLISLSFMLH